MFEFVTQHTMQWCLLVVIQSSMLFGMSVGEAQQRGVVWDDVKEYSPERVYLVKAREESRTAMETTTVDTCIIKYYSATDVVVSGYRCGQIPTLETFRNISQLSVHDTVVVTIKAGTFATGSHLTKLELSQNRITTIEPNSFIELQDLRYLALNDNPIRGFHPDAFKGLEQLRKLILFRTQIQHMSSIVPAVVALPNIDLLDLGFTPITEVGEHDLEDLRDSKLKHLSLYNCASLLTIHPRALSPLQHLEGLYLKDSSKLAHTETSYHELLDFVGNLTQPTLRVLDVGRIGRPAEGPRLFSKIAQTSVSILKLSQLLKEINDNTFPLMPNITAIIVPYAKVTVYKGGFDRLPNLREIVFEKSFSEFTESMALPRLEYLDVSGYEGNEYSIDFPNRVFAGMSRLRFLNIRNRIISDLYNDTFDGLASLEYLDMANTRVSCLPPYLFLPLVNLTYLDLSGNTIFAMDLSADTFAPLANLRSLNLASTYAQWLSPAMFAHLLNLERLNLNGNLLTSLPDLSFNRKLRSLHIASNRILRFEMSCHENGTYENRLPESLQELDLSSNRISSYISIPNSVSYLDLSNNPFRCDCDMPPLLGVLQVPDRIVYNFEFTEAYQCQEPKTMQGVHIGSAGFALEHACQPEMIMLVVAFIVVLLVLVALLLGALIYRRRVTRWLKNYGRQPGRGGGDGSEARKSFKYDAFVSYSAHDVHFVIYDLVPRLETLRNLKLCVYDRDFLAGKSITNCVMDSMKRSRKIILLLSEHFLQSPWCRFETEMAQFMMLEENRDAVILLKIAPIDETQLSAKLSYLLRTRVHLDYNTTAREKFFSKLVEAIRGEVPRQQKLRKNISEFQNRAKLIFSQKFPFLGSRANRAEVSKSNQNNLVTKK